MKYKNLKSTMLVLIFFGILYTVIYRPIEEVIMKDLPWYYAVIFSASTVIVFVLIYIVMYYSITLLTNFFSWLFKE